MNGVTVVIQAKRTNKTTSTQKNTVQSQITIFYWFHLTKNNSLSIRRSHYYTSYTKSCSYFQLSPVTQSPLPKSEMPTSTDLKSTHSLSFHYPAGISTDPSPQWEWPRTYMDPYTKHILSKFAITVFVP